MSNLAGILLSVLLGCACLNAARAQSVAPNPRHLEELAYDKHRDRLFLFGGAELHDKTWREPDDFYAFSSEWKKQTGPAPHGRRGHAMVYDETSKKILVIGGVTTTHTGADSLLFDTWSWSDNNWKLVNAKCPVKEGRAVYSPHSKSIYLYGDAADLSKAWEGDAEQKFELWEFKDQTWTKLSDKGPTNGWFPLAYNKESKSVTILEWRDSSLLLWEWKNNAWHTKQFDNGFPPARGKYAFSYCDSEEALFIFGGTNADKNLLGDFWKYDGSTWRTLSLPTNPSPRASLRLVNAGDRLLLYGGLKQGGLTNELWEFKRGEWKKL